jgi:hypothetical protein
MEWRDIEAAGSALAVEFCRLRWARRPASHRARSVEQFEHAFNHKADLNLIRGIETHNGLVNALMKDQKVWRTLRREMMRVVYQDIRKGEAPS